jgi:iron(III) transport system permease protein
MTIAQLTFKNPFRGIGLLMSWLNIWSIGTFIIASIIVIPIASIIYLGFMPAEGIWTHLSETVLPLYIYTTILLMLGVGLGTLLIGVGTAWLVSMCQFPGKQIFEWALLLPMAMPAYVIAYLYTDIFEFAGPVQGLMRDLFGWQSKRDYYFPEIRSLGGAISMMTLVLYPYVYLLSRAAFLEQSISVIEASRGLGRGPFQSFFLVALPLARPAIIVGITLVLMETLNDFGTVDFFAVSTFTLGIYDVWLNMNNIAGAAQLAAVLLLFVMILILAERFARRKKRFHQMVTKYDVRAEYLLEGKVKIIAMVTCFLPVFLGFLVPAIILIRYSFIHYETSLSADFLSLALNSLMLSSLAAIIAILMGVFMAYGVRLRKERLLKIMTGLACMGYAVPGSVLAVGVMFTLGTIDNGIDGFMRDNFNISTGLLFSGTIAAVTFGYLVRFLALSFGTIESSLEKITPNMDGASRSLGCGAFTTLQKVHIPLIRASILTASMMIFVDCMKELPMTVILRPFNFQTLATFVHQYATDEQLGEASLAALSIVGFGILPVIVLSLAIKNSRPNRMLEETA